MFMGSRAFEYYLPVIDRYLREVSGREESDGCEAIIGSGVVLQLDRKDAVLSGTALVEIEELSAFVRANLPRFSPEGGEQRRIEREWKLVDEKIATSRNASESERGATGR